MSLIGCKMAIIVSWFYFIGYNNTNKYIELKAVTCR